MAMRVQELMYNWLHESVGKRRVAIFDATNTTKARRLALAHRARREGIVLNFNRKHYACESHMSYFLNDILFDFNIGVFLLFVESICDDPVCVFFSFSLNPR